MAAMESFITRRASIIKAEAAPVSHEFARSFRDASMAGAWHTANVRAGKKKDAKKDMMEFTKHIQDLGKLDIVTPELADAMKTMILAISWHASNSRKGYQQHAAKDKEEFNAAKALLKEIILNNDIGIELDVVELLASLSTSCAWYAANKRKGYSKDAKVDMLQVVRTFNCLFVKRRPKWLGVNLGGWLLLEKGPAAPLFENMGFDGDEEYGFCEFLNLPAFKKGNGLTAAEVYETHRRSHVTESTIMDIKAMGLNAVRVPFGYWCVIGATSGDPYVGPALEHIDNVVNWCERHALQVLLDLHGNPGGESSEKPCGRSLKGWGFGHWRKEEALQVLRIIATRYKDRACIAGLQVANETGRLIDPVKLVDHYADCARVIRESGMLAENVAVVCPFYFHAHPIGTPQKRRFLKRWDDRIADLDHCILDLHYYHFSEFDRENLRGSLQTQVNRYSTELEGLPATVVGEFSAGRPPSCTSMTQQKFFEMQLSLYMANSTHGAFFWCWSDGAGVDWSLKDGDEARRQAVKDAAELNRQRNPGLEPVPLPREELIRKLSIKENDDSESEEEEGSECEEEESESEEEGNEGAAAE